MKKVLTVDQKRCLACRSCELQCAIVHSESKEMDKAIYEEPTSQPRIKVKSRKGHIIISLCRHCDDAPCVKACPNNAIEIFREKRAVVINEELCTGCKLCVSACPFRVIKIDKDTGKALKCDLCIERLNKDKIPACVEGCPTGALKFLW